MKTTYSTNNLKLRLKAKEVAMEFQVMKPQVSSQGVLQMVSLLRVNLTSETLIKINTEAVSTHISEGMNQT